MLRSLFRIPQVVARMARPNPPMTRLTRRLWQILIASEGFILNSSPELGKGLVTRGKYLGDIPIILKPTPRNLVDGRHRSSITRVFAHRILFQIQDGFEFQQLLFCE